MPEDVGATGEFDAVICLGNSFAHLPDETGDHSSHKSVCDHHNFQDIEDLVEAVREENPEILRFETSVFDGNYITGDIDQAYLERVDSARGESAKSAAIQTELSNLEMHNIDAESEA